MNITSIITKDYENKPSLRVPAKQTQSNPISKAKKCYLHIELLQPASPLADTAKAVVKRLDIGELVDVKTVRVEPVTETVFLGRWRGATRGDVHEIDVRPKGVCHVTMGDRFGKDKTPGAIKAGITVSGTWLLTTNEIVIDINDKSPHGCDYVYRGYLDEDGNLIVDKGVIYPQGSFRVSGEPRQMILKKVE